MSMVTLPLSVGDYLDMHFPSTEMSEKGLRKHYELRHNLGSLNSKESFVIISVLYNW